MQLDGLKSMVAMGAKGGNVALFAQCLTKVLEIVAKAVDEAQVSSCHMMHTRLHVTSARQPVCASPCAGHARHVCAASSVATCSGRVCVVVALLQHG